MIPASLSLPLLAAAMLTVFVAAIVRGYAGFGLSAFVVASLGLLLPHSQVVPLVFMLEIAAGFHLLPGAWRSVDWRQLAWILPGAVVGTPIGLRLLGALPIEETRLVTSIFILTASLWIASGKTLKAGRKPLAALGGGLVSGIANGSAGVGGLPLVALFLSNETTAQRLRATLVVYFIITNAYATAVGATSGLIDGTVLTLLAISLIPLAAGVAIGSRRFKGSDQRTYRTVALGVLIALATIGILRSGAKLL